MVELAMLAADRELNVGDIEATCHGYATIVATSPRARSTMSVQSRTSRIWRLLASTTTVFGSVAICGLTPTVGAVALRSVPTHVVVVPSSHELAVSWAAVRPEGGNQAAYVATVSPEGKKCTTTRVTCAITGLRNGQRYDVRVVAVFSRSSSTTSGVVTGTPGDVPSPPTYVTVSPGDTAAIVAWQPSHSDGGLPIQSYQAVALPSGLTCSTSGSTSCMIRGLHQGESVTVKVVAMNSIGSSPASLPSPSVTTGLAPVLGVTAVAGINSATISWIRIPRTSVLYVVRSMDGQSSCQVVDQSACTVRIRHLSSSQFSVTGHVTTPDGLTLSTLPSVPTHSLPMRVVFVLAGQSNATGAATEPPPGNGTPISGATDSSSPADKLASLSWDSFDYLPVPKPGWLPLATPQIAKSSTLPTFGPERGLARQAYADSGALLSILKVTYGGTSLAGAWNPLSPKSLFHELVRFTNQQLIADREAGTIDLVRGFIWFQGESDATSATTSVAYHDNLKEFLDALQKAVPFGDDASTVLIKESSDVFLAAQENAGLCPDDHCAAEREWDATVRSADDLVAAERDHVSTLDSKGLERLPGGAHLTLESQLFIGRELAEVLRSSI